ncbi:hypothetical protein NYE39_15150 [Janibacter sp. FSL W8-0316]|uniref:hypothetical protein n=1 Tax=Janibacter sp. FSL W8-0316 TaxID=2975325 RepID=UPI0030F9FA26
MTRPLAVGAIAAFLTTAGTPLVTRILRENAHLDVPNSRSSHTQPTPRGGGIACLAAFGTTVTAAAPSSIPRSAVTGIVAISALGMADDLLGGISPGARILGQGLGAALLPSNHPFDRVLVPVGTVSMVNAVNFMDGINGITGGTIAAWAVNALLLRTDYDTSSIDTLAGLALGTAVGFLPWNSPQAKVFLGDSGSYLYGALLSAALASAPRTSHRLQLAAPLLLYATDTSTTLFRRLMRGDSITAPHRDHVYQQLAINHEIGHFPIAALHTAGALTAGLLWQSKLPLTQRIAFTAAIVGGYTLAPTLIKRLHFTRKRVDQ